MDSQLKMREILTADEPLGPSYTEAILRSPQFIFKQLYDRSNGVHARALREDPVYVVGRKGSGKTAFLLGAPLAETSKIVRIKSEDIYHEIEKLRLRYSREVGQIFAENLASVWKTLLAHAAMLAACRTQVIKRTPEGRHIQAYIGTYGDPSSMEAGALMARVAAPLSDALIANHVGQTLDEACMSLERDVGTYSAAFGALRSVVDKTGFRLYVVVDNLEELHERVDSLKDTLAALFRATRDFQSPVEREQPFKVRFAFPAELLHRLREFTSHPEKDFSNYVVIQWTAAELMTIAGNRLRRYLELHHGDQLTALGLAWSHDEHDQHQARDTLRAVLPRREMRTGLSAAEDPVAYVMRHTQLLPRHLIEMLNKILRKSATRGSGLPIATPREVVDGVREAELTIVQGVLGSYAHDYPYMSKALSLLRNHIPTTLSCSDLHKAFNSAGVARAGVDYSDFLEGALDVGVLGIRESRTDRYTVGRFSYTFGETLRPVEGEDELCVHPLFMTMLFDGGSVRKLRERAVLPVYPYGHDFGQLGEE